MTDRKKRGVAFWATVVVVVLVLHPISYGPAAFVRAHERCPGWLENAIWISYQPIIRLMENQQQCVPDWYWSYLDWFLPRPDVVE